MKKTTLVFSLLTILFAVACKNIGFEKSKSGLEYKIIKGDGGAQLGNGDIVKFQYKVTYNDSVVISTYATLPVYDQVDSVGRFHDFSEFLSKMKVGDSAVCYQLYDTLIKGSPYGVPPYMKKGEKQQITIKLLAAFQSKNGQNPRDLAMADFQSEMSKMKEREIVTIQKYLDKKQIKAEKVNNSVFVQMTQEGTGAQADSGMVVGVKYTGYNFEGKYFDSNMDSTKQTQRHPLDTFFFVAKGGGAIQGMLEGITVFKKGGKGTMYIPSSLAYGPQGSSNVIKPNESLIFDIEVVDVKPLPKQSASPEMQQPVRK